MINPIETERRFQDLTHRLALPASPRQRLLSIFSFLESLDHHVETFESYILELLQQMPDVIHRTDFTGLDPETLRAIYNRLTTIVDSVSTTNSIPEIAKPLEYLRIAAARQFALVGDLPTALDVIGDSSPKEWIDGMQRDSSITPRMRVERAIAEAEKRGDSSISLLRELLAAWPSHSSKDESVLVPVVEKPLMEREASACLGGLRRVTLKVLGPSTDSKDQLHADVSVYGVESSASAQLEYVAKAARKLLEEKHPALSGTFVNAQLTFDGEYALHQGESANLAIAALVCCAVARFGHERSRSRLLPTVAITGTISAAGDVLPVEEAGLVRKVEATFFSQADCLVVPKQQVGAAESIAGPLAGKYPRRNLQILGVGHLREVFYDRRVVDTTLLSLPRHLANRAWKWRRLITGVFLLALLAVIFRLTNGPLDKNPVIYEFKGEMLLLKNKSNRVVDEIRVGERTVNAFLAGGGLIRPVGFADVDRDGRNEIFWWQYPFAGSSGYTIVSCKSVGREEPLWSVTTTKSISFPKSTDVSQPEFSAKQLIVDDLDGDGRYEVLATAMHNAFPCLLLKLEAMTGKELACYLHVGHLVDMKTWDLNGDGVKEVILCGINNAYKNACLVVLDPRDMSGHSPTTEDCVPTGYQPAHEKTYVRIPRTIIGFLYESRVKYNAARFINIEESKRIIRVYVQDVYGIDDGRPNERVTAGSYLNFGFDFSPIGITSGDDFDALYDYHLKEKQIPAINRNDYLRQYKDTMLYWDGEKWGNSPIKKQQHEETVKRK